MSKNCKTLSCLVSTLHNFTPYQFIKLINNSNKTLFIIHFQCCDKINSPSSKKRGDTNNTKRIQYLTTTRSVSSCLLGLFVVFLFYHSIHIFNLYLYFSLLLHLLLQFLLSLPLYSIFSSVKSLNNCNTASHLHRLSFRWHSR